MILLGPSRVLMNRVLASQPGAAPAEEKEQKGSWFSKLLTVRQIDPGKTSHSQMLSDKDTVYELTSKFSVSLFEKNPEGK